MVHCFFSIGLVAVLSAGVLFNAGPCLGGGERARQEKETDESKAALHPREYVTVTAASPGKAVKDCSASVSIVDERDLKAVSANHALNALNYLPGIFIQRTGDFGRSDVEIRGLGQRGQRISIMVDGRPEKMGLFGCAVTHAYPLDNVDRIEVVRGPSSVLYGSDALGGVVNILTHFPAGPGFETDLTTSYGAFNTQRYTLRHGAALKKWRYFLTLDRQSSDGHLPSSEYAGNTFTGKAEYDLTDHVRLGFQSKYYQGKKYEPGPQSLPDLTSWNDYERAAVDVGLQGRWDRDEFFLKIYRDFGHHQFSDGWNSRDFVDGAVLRYTTRRIADNELSVGGEFRSFGGKSYNFPRGKWDKNESALFVQNEHVFMKRWILSAGVRANRDSLYGWNWCPQAGLVFQPRDGTLVRAAVSKGFRSPQINELFMFPASNPLLKPENVWNYEIGFERDFGTRLRLGASVFEMKGDNLIETGLNPSLRPKFIFLNSGTFDFHGAELSLKGDFARSLSALVFYTYLDPKDRTKGRPGHKVDMSLRYNTDRIFAALAGQYITDYYAGDHSRDQIPSYLVVNARADVRLFKALSVFIEANNLFDADYRIYADLSGAAAGLYLMPGRNLNVGLRAGI
jgi:iron complex outermembrane receptor protein